jgi:aspartate racemase
MTKAGVAVMKRIGILGGSSDQATADYYRRFNKATNELFGGWNTAELVISSMNFAFSRDCALNGQWDAMADYLADRAIALERAGADLLLCASNTLHRLADRFTQGITIPFLHIVDPTAEAILKAGLQNIALLGTKTTMATDHLKSRFRSHFGIEIMVPEPQQQDMIDRIIFEELCRGRFTPAAKSELVGVIMQLQNRGATGVILGCTEIPILIKQEDFPAIPLFDTAELHVRAALEFAVGKSSV